MVNFVVKKAIVFKRINYGEADRIITILSSEGKKITLHAKGVRKVKSKLAGSIEPFGIFEATYLPPKTNSMGTLISARLLYWPKNILKDSKRITLLYELLKITNQNLLDESSPDFFNLLNDLIINLDNENINLSKVKNWYMANFIRLNGITPNLIKDDLNNNLKETEVYDFDFDKMCFYLGNKYDKNFIKYLRIIFNQNKSELIYNLNTEKSLDDSITEVLNCMFKNNLLI